MKVGAGLFLSYALLALILIFAESDEDIDAFCSFEDLEASAACGESCAVHESGAWFTASPELDRFSPETFPGYSGTIVPMVPLCSSGQGAKTYIALTGGPGMTAVEAEEACKRHSDGTFHLASIASADENERARQVCGDNSCWLGLQSTSPLHWAAPSEWNDGTRFDYANWWPVNQPPEMEDPNLPQVYVFMNVPGAEPGEQCSALRVHMYVGMLALFCIGGLSALGLYGASTMERNKLDIVWKAWIGMWAVTLVLSAVETSIYTGINPFVPTAWVWGLWAFGEFLVAAPLNTWWIIAVRSLASQCDDGSLSTDVDLPIASIAERNSETDVELETE